MNVTQFGLFEDKLGITGLVLDAPHSYDVDHDASLHCWAEDGTEVRMGAERCSVSECCKVFVGRLITNFAGPINNFILSIVVHF